MAGFGEIGALVRQPSHLKIFDELNRRIGKAHTIANGAHIFIEGKLPDFFYKVISGVICTYRLLNDGRRRIDAFHMVGDVFGLEACAEHRFSAKAMGEVKVIAFPRCRLDKLLASDMALSQEIISSLMGSLERAQNHAVLLRHDTAKERMSAFLVDMAERAAKGGNLALRLRQSDIADYLGLSRETVSRILTQLARKHRTSGRPIDRSGQHGGVPFRPNLVMDAAD